MLGFTEDSEVNMATEHFTERVLILFHDCFILAANIFDLARHGSVKVDATQHHALWHW